MIRAVLLALIRLYQLTLSRLILGVFGPVCRFEPSCSRYAMACIEGQGALRGSLLSVKRLCKCHPFHPGGYDPPPPPRLRPRHDVARHDDGASPATPGSTAAPSGHPSTPGGEIPLTPH